MNNMELYILVVRNKLKDDPEDDVQKFIAWVRRKTPFNPIVEYLNLALETKFKDFEVVPKGYSFSEWGLDGIKQQLRNTGKIAYGKYHAIGFLYEAPPAPELKQKIAAWTYVNDLNGSAFFEIPCASEWGEDQVFRMMTHEILHCMHRLCWWKNITTNDTMDLYDKEFEVNAPDGNRARNLIELGPHWNLIGQLPISRAVQWIYEQVQKLLQLLKAMPKKTGLENMALAIKEREGYYAPGENRNYPNGTRSWRNKNPGNLKFTSYTIKDLGATAEDRTGIKPGIPGFAVFKDYPSGLKALVQFLTDAANNVLRDYKNVNLLQFFAKYAPTNDHNDPNSYAVFVASRLGVSPQTMLKNLAGPQ